MSFHLSPRSSTLDKRFSTRTKPAAFKAATDAFGIANADLARPKLVDVMNATSGLLRGTVELTAVKSDTLRSMCVAFNVPLPAEDDDEPEKLQDLLQARFFGEDEIRAMMDSEIEGADLSILLFWADALSIQVPVDASREDVRDMISRARLGLAHDAIIPDVVARKRKLDTDTLMMCETDDLRRLGHALLGENFAQSSSRRELVDGLRDLDAEESLLSATDRVFVGDASTFVAASSSSSSANRFHESVRGVTPAFNLASQSRGQVSEPVLDMLFRSPARLPPEFSGSFVLLNRSQLQVGNIVADVSTPEPSLFRVSAVLPDVSITSVRDRQVFGSLITVQQCWVATEHGLAILSRGNYFPQSSREPVVPAPLEVIDLQDTPSQSIRDLFRSAASSARQLSPPLGSLAPSRPSGFNPGGIITGNLAVNRGCAGTLGGSPYAPLEGPLGSDLFSPARQDRYEANRGFRTILGHNASRLLDLTNNTGNYTDDRAFNNVIVEMHPDDRSLPALSRQQLKFLLSLQFSLTYDAAKPTGVHLQAFRVNGTPFQYVIQIHDALLTMVRVLDTIRDSQGPVLGFFFTLFGPMLESLRSANQVGLSKLPANYVIKAISDVLLLFGCRANYPAADNWTTPELQLANLSPSLAIDVTRHVSIASLEALSMHHKRPDADKGRSSGRSSSAGRSSTSGRGRPGLGGRTTSQYLRHASGSQSQGVSSGGDQPPASTPKGLCISALFEKYGLGSGCHKVTAGTCPFNHNVALASKDDQRVAAGRVSKEDKKRQLLTAIG
jgi:hypothetical protein